MVKAAADLALKYEKHLNASELTEEITHFKQHAISLLLRVKYETFFKLLEFINIHWLTFFQILTLSNTIGNVEHSFSTIYNVYYTSKKL